MKKKSTIIPLTATAILVLVVVLYLYLQHQKTKRLEQLVDQQIRANGDLQSDLFQVSRAYNQQTELVNDLVRRNPPKDAETVLIIKDMNELAKIFTLNLPQMAMEMESASKQLGADQPLDAVFSLAKVVENGLKTLFLNDEVFLNRYKKKTITLANCVSYIEDEGLCTPKEISFLKELKNLRNDIAHQLDVRKPKSYVLSFLREATDFVKGNASRFSMGL
ncbi:hypothetical protein [Persicitalea sp.]|uniref:hypothetical protein n=1 Tax=Persicitalea sp. TaxID=3100273 RepID=UPI0035936054